MRSDFKTVDFHKTRRDVWHTSLFHPHTSQFQTHTRLNFNAKETNTIRIYHTRTDFTTKDTNAIRIYDKILNFRMLWKSIKTNTG
jgi:hypothetical protein